MSACRAHLPHARGAGVQLEEETNEEVLLHRHLTGAQGSLKKAYDALNEQYALGGTAGMTNAQQYLADARLFESLPEDHDDSASMRDLASAYKHNGENSQGLKGEDDDVSEQSVEMPHGCDPRLRPARLLTQARPPCAFAQHFPAAPAHGLCILTHSCCCCIATRALASHWVCAASQSTFWCAACALASAVVRRSVCSWQSRKLAMQAEFEEQLMTEERARKRLTLALWPLLLYIFFICASGFYAYARVAYGMAGLNPQLTIYSYVVLVVELLGAINMLFYGCWLFAKPDNRDIFSKLDDKARPVGFASIVLCLCAGCYAYVLLHLELRLSAHAAASFMAHCLHVVVHLLYAFCVCAACNLLPALRLTAILDTCACSHIAWRTIAHRMWCRQPALSNAVAPNLI